MSFVISTGLQELGTSFMNSTGLQELGMRFVISTGKGKHNKIQNNNEHPKALNIITVRWEEMPFHRQHEGCLHSVP
jgi:hypothetical protein